MILSKIEIFRGERPGFRCQNGDEEIFEGGSIRRHSRETNENSRSCESSIAGRGRGWSGEDRRHGQSRSIRTGCLQE